MHKQTIYVFNAGHHFNTRSQQFLSVLLLLLPSKSNCNRIAHNPHISPTLSGLSTYKYNRQSDRIGDGERERERYAKEDRKERDQRQRVFPAAVDHLRRNSAMEIRLLHPSSYPLHFLTQTKVHTEERVRDSHCSFNTGFSILCSRFTGFKILNWSLIIFSSHHAHQ
ncbi:hypothetical protein LXL04_005697 [Taraxacum kok-saghyz]